eukprot:GHUV01043289.1.p1 GENE.GHUV01043289.1~~GHUV01043289.1.p1  ORF type:complete len:305 (+),score=59.91 GHUV01043289.1:230-1144(+)
MLPLHLNGQRAAARLLVTLGRPRATNGAAATPFAQHLRYSSDDKDNKGKEGGLIQGILKSWSEKRGDGVSDSNGNAAPDAVMVPGSPEHKHRKMFVVELQRKPLFPGIYTPVLVLKNEALIKEVMEAKKHGGQAYVGAFLAKPDKVVAEEAEQHKQDSTEDAAAATASDGDSSGSGSGSGAGSSSGNHLYDVGTFAQVHTILAGDTADSAQLLLLGHRRIKREAVLSASPLRVVVSHLRDEAYVNSDHVKATSMELVNTMKDLLNMNPLYGEQFRTLMSLTGWHTVLFRPHSVDHPSVACSPAC